jgi:hypothetical protein
MVQKPAKKKSSTPISFTATSFMPRDPTVADCPRALVETTGSNLGLAKVQMFSKRQ